MAKPIKPTKPKKQRKPKLKPKAERPEGITRKDNILFGLKEGIAACDECITERRNFESEELKLFNKAVGEALVYLLERVE